MLIRYEGPRGGPGMQEMLYPTSYLKSKGLGKVCALVTDGRFSGGTSGLSIGHCLAGSRGRRHRSAWSRTATSSRSTSPNAALHLAVPEAVLAVRRAAMEAKGDAAWQPAEPRQRQVSTALRAYAAMATSAARGAVRDVPSLRRR